MSFIRLVSLIFLSLVYANVFAQNESDEGATINNFKGLQYKSPDSSFYINFRFRMQNRIGAFTTSGSDLSFNEYEARVRRLRMRVDGFIMNPKLSYSVQLAFTRGDQDVDNTGIANIVRDAIIFYQFTPKFYMGFGQNKLPGNRQRVNSSGQLQFADRSIVNGALTIDRDFGLKAYYHNKIGEMDYHLKGAITTGEGRSVNSTDNGLAYTGRIELLPMGSFTGDGDYSEGDLEREPKPKISIAAGYSMNKKTNRTGGQLGKELYNPVDMATWMIDAIGKYRGWAYSVEYIKRHVDNPLTFNTAGSLSYAFTGNGINHQASYIFPSNIEFAFRYSRLTPSVKILAQEDKKNILELGATKYLNKHRVKMQLNLNYMATDGNYALKHPGNKWGVLAQFELGI
ncbi:MAG: porin [Sphingobacteriales bacterium 17-39-43]|uniref:porin n=1 Tax=Daejeonella sp. TaxID=2805397 RepID=UPI000BD6A1FC|nr:porin [Daejeonella sp.]OYZ31332.1 MAG: porin [Sphingobacteriales bacterium 16-39-50]OZA24330.1 MAG: porin [Sphingobacteriales bacterium 17-39-43]HQT24255.1 porin [Daejeonella sp.]HQT59083.1 porin [Daejeonella sp.]